MSSVLSLKDFCELFGAEEADLGPAAQRLIEEGEFSYSEFSEADRDTLIQSIETELADPKRFSTAGAGRKEAWDAGWGECLAQFKETGSLEALIPQYFRDEDPLRFRGTFIQPQSPRFELNVLRVLRAYLAHRYLIEYQHIFEFGCGTGYHLAQLGEDCPECQLHAYDWAASTPEIIESLKSEFSLSLDGGNFNYFAPDEMLEVPADSVFLTCASLEQIGNNFKKFLTFIYRKEPELCVHIECLEELYDESDPLDRIGKSYHQQRRYLSGFLSRIQELEAEGKAEIELVERVSFGGKYHAPYSILVWRPRY